MRLRDQIRAVACVSWVTVLGSATYFAREARPSRAGVIRVSPSGGTLPGGLGVQETPTRPRTGEARTGRKGLAKSLTPGYACCQSVPVLQKEQSREIGSTHGVRLAPLPVRQPVSLLKEAGRGSFQQMATDAANLCGVEPALFHALIERESSWRPYVVSRSGAVGLAQVKPSTARGVSPTLDVRDPWQNLVAGACYLRAQFDRFGSWRKALHAYRLGPNARVSVAAREYASDIITGSAQ